MNNPQDPDIAAGIAQPVRRQSRFNKQIVFLICIYIILTMSSFSSKTPSSDEELIKKIQDNNIEISKQTLLLEVSKHPFQGQWNQKKNDLNTIIDGINGKFKMFISVFSEEEKLSLDITVKKGSYIDDGVYKLNILELESQNWVINKTSSSSIEAKITFNSTQTKVSYQQYQIFKTVSHGSFGLEALKINFQVSNNILIKKIMLNTQNSELIFELHPFSASMLGSILFSLILIIISYSQFSACLQIIRNFIEGTQNPFHYSFISLVMAMMWDAALCLTSFVQAFENQENIFLFIVPAFLLCLLFTNLELRIMVSVFQAFSGQTDLRQVICRFNLASYGGIIAMYPLIFFTNLGTPIFICFSLIFLPQIYTNAMTGKRPNPNSIYYNQFLLFRFMIILYLKCFPYNVFNLKPNYLLGFGCLLIVACQFGLLWIQKIYGPKKVLPRFLLPPVFGYKYELSVEERGIDQCAICLQSLSKQPEGHPDDIEIGFKIMKTPCEHKYHSCCLLQWMNLKMECPQCRQKLPPFE